MVMRIKDFWPSSGAAVSGDGHAWSWCDPVSWKSLHDRERVRAEAAEARADAAETRCEELRWQEVQARHRASCLKTVSESNRAKLHATREEVREVRRTAKQALGLEKEVARLGRLLAEAGVDARKRSTVMSLRMENGALKAEVKELTDRVAALEAQNDELRSSRSSMSRSMFGRKSEKGPRASSKRGRGQQPGAPGHGRTPRPALKETKERLDPPKDARICSCCGKPYVANGSHESEVIEIEIKAHKRRIIRRRWRPGCDCAISSPREVTAPPPARLFSGTAFGTSVWAHVLHERFVSMRPCRRVADWLTSQGLAVSPGTLAGCTGRMLPLFEPLRDAILAHQNEAGLRHADETGWRIQALREIRKSRRAWLWTSVSHDAVLFHIDPSRSAEAAAKLFVDAAGPVHLVCDRFSAYKKLARLWSFIVLCFCWVHCRRDILDCAAGRPWLEGWRDEWIGRIGEIYHLNAVRLDCLGSGGRSSAGFEAAQAELEAAVAALFAEAGRQLERLAQAAPEGRPLRSLLTHREGLSVFLHHPEVPMDNNVGERALRGPAIGRKLSFGSDSEDGARLSAVMYTVLFTVAMNGLDVLRWLRVWLDACAENGGRPPGDLSPWLPWLMSAQRRRAFAPP